MPLSGRIGGTRSQYRTKPGTNSRAIEREIEISSIIQRNPATRYATGKMNCRCDRVESQPSVSRPQTIRPKDVAAAAVAEEKEDDGATFFFPFFYLRHTAVDWPLVGTTHKHLVPLSCSSVGSGTDLILHLFPFARRLLHFTFSRSLYLFFSTAPLKPI